MNRYKRVMAFSTNKYSLLSKGYRSWDPHVQSNIQNIDVASGNTTVGPCAADSSSLQFGFSLTRSTTPLSLASRRDKGRWPGVFGQRLVGTMTQTQETPLIFVIITGAGARHTGGDPMTKAQHQPLSDLRSAGCCVELCVLGSVNVDEEVQH